MPLTLSRREDSTIWWISGRIRGTRIRESTGTRDRALAEEVRAVREAELLREAVHGSPARRSSWAEVVLSYLRHGGPHTDATRARVARVLKHFGPLKAADDIDQAALDGACTALLRAAAAPATRQREVITPVRAILTHGASRRMCAAPIFQAARGSAGRTEWLTPSEVDRLVNSAAPHLAPLLTFLAATGARLSEALTLVWEDVDLIYGRATLRDVKARSGVVKDRIVVLCPRALAAIASVTGPIRNRRLGGGFYPRATTGAVFRTIRGDAYAEKHVQGGGQIKTGWASAMRRAQITRAVTPHSLRHTWASWHYAVHKDLLLLRHEGDWSTVKLVERYAHLTPAGMAREIEAWRSRGTIQTRPEDVAANLIRISAA